MLTLCFLPFQRSWSWARPPRPLPTAPPLSEHFLVLLLSILTPLYTWPRCAPDPNHGISMWPCSHVPGGTFVTFPCAFCASLTSHTWLAGGGPCCYTDTGSSRHTPVAWGRSEGCGRPRWGPWLARQWGPLTTQSLGMARLEVVDDQARVLVYVPQLQHVLPVLVPLLHLQQLGACVAEWCGLQPGPLPGPPPAHSQQHPPALTPRERQ